MSADLRIDEELAICEAATPAPWRVDVGAIMAYEKEHDWFHMRGPIIKGKPYEEGTAIAKADAEFAAHARTGYPLALRRIQELEASHARLRELLAGVYRIDCAGTLGSIQGDVTLTEDDLAEVKKILCISTKEIEND